MPTNAPGSVTSPTVRVSIEPGQQRVRSRRPDDLQPGVPVGQPESHARLHLPAAGGEFVEGAPTAEDGRGERPADEDARHRDERHAPDRHEPREQQRPDDGQDTRSDRRGRPTPGAIAGDAAAGGPYGHGEHQRHEPEKRGHRAHDPADEQGDGGELGRRPHPSDENLARPAQRGPRGHGGGEDQQDGEDDAKGDGDRKQHAATIEPHLSRRTPRCRRPSRGRDRKHERPHPFSGPPNTRRTNLP